MHKNTLTLGALALAIVLFFAVNILANAGLRSARVDLTEEKLFTLSQGTRNVLAKLEEPVQLYLYFSAKEANALPAYKAYGQRVREFLEEYALLSPKLRLTVIEPEPFSEEQDRADQAGLIGRPIDRDGSALYFGLVGTNSTDGNETIPFFDPSNERTLEYDVTRLVHSLANPTRRVVGLVTSLPLEGEMANPMTGMRGGSPPWQVLAQLRQLFDVRTLEPGFSEVEAGIDVLVLAHPKGLSDASLYAIDQFALRGGRVLAFVDPMCEADVPPTDPSNPFAAAQADRSSNLGPLLGAWGVELVPGKVAADLSLALQVTVGSQSRPETVPNPVWLGLDELNFEQKDMTLADLRRINMPSPGVLQARAGASTSFEPLIRTTEQAMQVDASTLGFMSNPKKLVSTYAPGGQALVLAARVSGKVQSAFPQGRPAVEGAPAEAAPSEHLAESSEPLNLVVVADADLLEDRFWIQPYPSAQFVLGYQKSAENGDFAINAVDNLAGSSDLISIRGRAQYARPFRRFQEIQREAEREYLAEEQALESKLRDTEARLEALQRERGEQSELILTPEQQQEIDRFKEQVVDTRRALRDVQHNLGRDIERLETRIKLINTGFVPLIVGVAAVGLLGRRVRRRQR